MVKKILDNIEKEQETFSFFDQLKIKIESTTTIQKSGYIANVVGNVVYSLGPQVQLGSICSILINNRKVFLEVIAFQEQYIILFPLENILGIYSGLKIDFEFFSFAITLSPEIKSCIFDGLGRRIKESQNDNREFQNKEKVLVSRPGLDPIKRMIIRERFHTGIKSIDSLLSVGKGQRMGIFAGSGVGKTTLLTMLAKYTQADVNVIALIGERGREASEFIKEELGKEGREKSILVISTSDKSAMERVKAAYVATTIAEYFRDQGKDVLLLVDSLTRFAMAQREIGLAMGEPATSRGYTPSVFSSMPKLLERVSSAENGSITAFYTVLVEGDDLNDPIADATRGILDGHIVLSREFASKGYYPAIDITNSISRLFSRIVSPKHLAISQKIRELIAVYEENKDTISLGAYNIGANPIIDRSIEKRDVILSFLAQKPDESFEYENTLKNMLAILS